MNYKKSDPIEMPADLPQLSEREERLLEALADGLDNTAAYRRAYDADGYSPAALRVQACRKVADPKIQQHLAALRAVGFANAGLTRQHRLDAELAFAQRCEAAGNFGAAGGAYDRINRLMGYYGETVQVVARDPLETLTELARIAPEAARALAAKAGIQQWQPSTETLQ